MTLSQWSLQKEMQWGHRVVVGGQFRFAGVHHILCPCMVKQAKLLLLFFSDDSFVLLSPWMSATQPCLLCPASELAGYMPKLVCMAVSIWHSNLQCLLNFSVH